MKPIKAIARYATGRNTQPAVGFLLFYLGCIQVLVSAWDGVVMFTLITVDLISISLCCVGSFRFYSSVLTVYQWVFHSFVCFIYFVILGRARGVCGIILPGGGSIYLVVVAVHVEVFQFL